LHIVQTKVKWSRYRHRMAQRVGRGITLLFHDRGTRRGWVVCSTPRPQFTPVKDPVPILQEAAWTPGPVWTGGKSRPHRDSILDLYTDWATRHTYKQWTYPLERPGTHFTGGWVGPRTGLDGRKISSPPGFDPGSLYRLSYPAHVQMMGLLLRLASNSRGVAMTVRVGSLYDVQKHTFCVSAS